MTVELLEAAAARLAPLLEELTFVGGATITLWITEPAAPPTRATDDVDLICGAMSYAEYGALAARMRELSFHEDQQTGVICRWRHPDGLVVDLMPLAREVLGFSNRWYEHAVATSQAITLPSGVEINVVAPAMAVATKLEAWHGRGRSDVVRSLDVHDIVVLANGRPSLHEEILELPAIIQEAIRHGIAGLLSDPYFDYVIVDAVGAYGASALDRRHLVRQRLEQIASGANQSQHE